MLILSSPSKTLDYDKPFQAPYQTLPHFLKQAEELVEILKNYSRPQLEKLMHVSSEIAELNAERFKVWTAKHTLENSRPAIVAYSGDIYQQVHENEYREQQASYLQDSLRIISGLYGLLKPYDLIQPYRLEMNAVLKTSAAENLYAFWEDKLTLFLSKEIEEKNEEVIVNLASEEYFRPINFKELKTHVIHVSFHQQKKNKVLNIGLLAKKARGMMIDFMVKNRIYDIAQLDTFDYAGYKLMAKTPDKLMFVRDML